MLRPSRTVIYLDASARGDTGNGLAVTVCSPGSANRQHQLRELASVFKAISSTRPSEHTIFGGRSG